LRDENPLESGECVLDKTCDENDMLTDVVPISNDTSERSPSQIPHDTAMAIKALSTQRQNGAETGGIALNHPVDGFH
jgi:hypothetical protein